MKSAMGVLMPLWSRVMLADHRRRRQRPSKTAPSAAAAPHADTGRTSLSRLSLASTEPDSLSASSSLSSAASSLFATVFLSRSTLAVLRARSGPTAVARTSTDERRLPSRSSYSLVCTYPTTLTGSPFPSEAPTPFTRPLLQQLIDAYSVLPGSQVPSAVRRRELLATRNL